MCIICVSKSGVRQPSDITLRAMFRRNPHGAGYMYARDGKVTIHKGFMNIEDFLAAVHAEQFTPQDSVVYHFRIQSRFHATLYSFPERVRRISTGSLQPLQYAIRWVETPQRKGKTAFPCIGGSV